MKPEPLKNKYHHYVDNWVDTSKPILAVENSKFHYRDVKSAVEWLKEKLCLNKTFCPNKKGKKWVCRNCQYINKAFEDVTRG